VPEPLLLRLRHHGRVWRIEMPTAGRVALLLEDYAFFADDVERFCGLLDGLVDLQGRERVGTWQALARSGQWAALFERLMAEHYDPLYDRSMTRHFDLAAAPALPLVDGSVGALDAAASVLRAGRN
jgi:tRNA 2-selenouridine synthase